MLPRFLAVHELNSMDLTTPKNVPMLSSPLSSPNIGARLKIKIISWSQETGLPVRVRVQSGDRTFNLHKHPLVSKSGYFKRELIDSNEVELPQDFPGGSETFEMIALFIYGSSTLINAFNVAALRCAAEFLEMTDEYSSGNLCERFDIYLNQVVLQSWDDTLIVLQRCQTLLPWAEQLLIVSRCIESLAFMACMEILDPERRRDHPVVTLETLARHPWSCETVNQILTQDLWIKDLICLPFAFFKRIIGSLRRQGMKEKYVSPIILFYAKKWVLLFKSYQSPENSEEEDKGSREKSSVILQGIVDILPIREKASKTIPVEFYFALLAKSLELNLTSDSREKLQDQIASVLHLAHVEDFLLPRNETEPIASSAELAVMESIISSYVSFHMDLNRTPLSNALVAELWDTYLAQVAIDSRLSSQKFIELVEIMPISSRQTHDHLYGCLNAFLRSHPDISQEEKGLVCKYLNCQKLSQEVCIEAVQNELMPLRFMVQALFIQQLHTHQAFKECSDSFRYVHSGEFSGSLSSSRYADSKCLNLGESPCVEGSSDPGCSRPLSFLFQKDFTSHIPEVSKKDYESASFRIQNLEQELMSFKRTLQMQRMPNKAKSIQDKVESTSENLEFLKPYGLDRRSMSKNRKTIGQMTNCIGSVNLASHRKYASRILKVLRRICLFGRGKVKRKPVTPGAMLKLQ